MYGFALVIANFQDHGIFSHISGSKIHGDVKVFVSSQRTIIGMCHIKNCEVTITCLEDGFNSQSTTTTFIGHSKGLGNGVGNLHFFKIMVAWRNHEYRLWGDVFHCDIVNIDVPISRTPVCFKF